MNKNNKFKQILLMSNPSSNKKDIRNIIKHVYAFLLNMDIQVFTEKNTVDALQIQEIPILEEKEYKNCDLLIVVGGDGSFLKSVPVAVKHKIPVIGINKGRLGFLTDILPKVLERQLTSILNGKFTLEERFLLQAKVQDEKKQELYKQIALNEIVLSQGAYPQMIEFCIYINDILMCNLRADGLIIATPTGSTAYALSGGGPILHTALDSIVIVPMLSHTLSARPIVIPADQAIKIHMEKYKHSVPQISLDSKTPNNVYHNQNVLIQKYYKKLTLIHPINYNYYETLRIKLNWHKKH
jgi:NAD+ kinase